MMNLRSIFRYNDQSFRQVLVRLERGVPSLIYGRFYENATCTGLCVLQMIASCLVLGICIHGKLSLWDLWWPIVNVVRIAMLMFFRLQHILKALGSNDVMDLQFRRLIMMFNWFGLCMAILWIPYAIHIRNHYYIFLGTTLGFLVTQMFSTVPLLGRAYGIYRALEENPNNRAPNDSGIMGQALLNDVDNDVEQFNMQLDDLEFARRLQAEENNRALNSSSQLREEQDRMFQEMERECFETEPLAIEESPKKVDETIVPPVEIPEPEYTREEPECGPEAIKLRMRLPSGEKLNRRFLVTDTVAEVHAYLDSLKMTLSTGERVMTYVLSTQFPREKFDNLNIPLMATTLIEGKVDETGTVVSPMIFVREI